MVLALSLRRTKRQVRLLEARLDGLATEQAEIGKRATGSGEKVAAEMRVLQKLLVQLSAQRERKPGPPPAAAPPPLVAEPLPMPAPRKVLDDAQILDIVREALNEEKVDLFLQPIVSLPQRRRRYFECFSRIRGENDTWIMPEQYLDVAKRAGLMGAIDNMLLFRCIQLVRKAQRHKHNLGFFCNISVHTLVDRAFFREFIEFMADNRELASQLTFEFAQEDIAAHWQDVSQDLYALARLGFYFSMDRVTRLDFDPQELAKRHFKFVKLDAAQILKEPALAVRALKRDMDRNAIDMIVEKIEHEGELVELLDQSFDFGQGYLFGEPRLSKDSQN